MDYGEAPLCCLLSTMIRAVPQHCSYVLSEGISHIGILSCIGYKVKGDLIISN